MKRKKLTIIFFSMMALAATPQAMHHFHNYVAAAQNRAQAELLQLLLSFSMPETGSRPAAPDTQQPPAGCEESAQRIAQVVTNEARATAAPARAQSRVERPVRNFEWKAEGFSKANELALERFLKSLETERRGGVKLAPQAALSLDPAAQAIYVNNVMRAAKLSEKRATRAMQRELIALSRDNARPVRKHAPGAPMRTVKADVPFPPVSVPGDADEDDQLSSEESFR